MLGEFYFVLSVPRPSSTDHTLEAWGGPKNKLLSMTSDQNNRLKIPIFHESKKNLNSLDSENQRVFVISFELIP